MDDAAEESRWYVQLRQHELTRVTGPRPTHFLWGNFHDIQKYPPGEAHARWTATYGPTYRLRSMLGRQQLYTTDPLALSYILQHSDVFTKPEQIRKGMTRWLGNGVLVAEGEDHRKQRKLLQPSFSPAAIRDIVPIFFDKAYELRDVLLALMEGEGDGVMNMEKAGGGGGGAGGTKIDMLRYLGKATLDIIGLAGFDYDFAALSSPRNELADAYTALFGSGQTFNVLSFLQIMFPVFKLIQTERTKAVEYNRQVTRRFGQKKRAVAGTDLKDVGKDVLSIMVRANMADDSDQRISDEEVLAQITTFASPSMLAGNETSSTALTWALYCLVQHPDVQDRLREEMLGVEERPSMDKLSSLPYTDAVVREVLRLYAPVTMTVRAPNKDVVVPLSKPVRGKDGTLMESVQLAKGSVLAIPILNVNNSVDIWGPDAMEFNPDRYKDLGSGPNQVPGVWGNLMTFLGGTRSCIGYKFSVVEIKVVLFVLVRSFVFAELPGKPVIEKKASMVMRPRVVGEEAAGFQLPLLVRPVM
ncbi:hypothetical protein P7C73_g5960, partial [Tremellales sp. Uapishka_1]